MIAVCNDCKTVTHTAPPDVDRLAYLCDHCRKTPVVPFAPPRAPAKPKREKKRSRHPAEGGPDPTAGGP